MPKKSGYFCTPRYSYLVSFNKSPVDELIRNQSFGRGKLFLKLATEQASRLVTLLHNLWIQKPISGKAYNENDRCGKLVKYRMNVGTTLCKQNIKLIFKTNETTTKQLLTIYSNKTT